MHENEVFSEILACTSPYSLLLQSEQNLLLYLA